MYWDGGCCPSLHVSSRLSPWWQYRVWWRKNDAAYRHHAGCAAFAINQKTKRGSRSGRCRLITATLSNSNFSDSLGWKQWIWRENLDDSVENIGLNYFKYLKLTRTEMPKQMKKQSKYAQIVHGRYNPCRSPNCVVLICHKLPFPGGLVTQSLGKLHCELHLRLWLIPSWQQALWDET